MLCDLHAKLLWISSVCYNSNYYLQNCVYLSDTQNVLIAVGGRSIRIPSRIFANSRLISVFSYCTF